MARQGLLRLLFVFGLAAAVPGGHAAPSGPVFRHGFEPPCQIDSDGDRLVDCVESASGRYVGPDDTGTDPRLWDTDGDGLGDGDEVLGSTDGLDLPALGVSPLRRDLLVEYDWFDDAHDCGAHSHRPSPTVLQRVAAVFANAPQANPDGSYGIRLIQDAGQGGVLTGGGRIDNYPAVLPGRFDSTWEALKREHFARNRVGYFHYLLLPHRYAGGSPSSGYAEILGDDAMVSLACATADDYVTRTIVHELGHNLGLHHGGFEACNNKPNYNSVLNYRYQFLGLDETCNAQGDRNQDGYSRGTRLPLDERNLVEPAGICGNVPIDWNRNGVLENGIELNLHAGDVDSCGSALRVLTDYDDYANLNLLGIRTASAKAALPDVDCPGPPPVRR